MVPTSGAATMGKKIGEQSNDCHLDDPTTDASALRGCLAPARQNLYGNGLGAGDHSLIELGFPDGRGLLTLRPEGETGTQVQLKREDDGRHRPLEQNANDLAGAS